MKVQPTLFTCGSLRTWEGVQGAQIVLLRTDMSRDELGPGETFDGPIVVDCSHMGRRASGIERVTRELFSAEALTPLCPRATPAGSTRLSTILLQLIANPVRAALHPRDVWIFPGYPPSPLFVFLTSRKVLYVHDLFLMTRWEDLNWAAKLYMAAPFRIAIAHFRYFFVNSLTTGRELVSVVRPGARIMPFRPPASNVFGLSPGRPGRQKEECEPIVVGALGTVEPRKNFLAAADIVQALQERLNRPVELHIIGRPGWGKDHDRLATMPHVRLRGFVSNSEIPEAVAKWDAVLCSSHSEGLGLPLLELQHAGLPIIAPDQPIFHEVLGASGVYVRSGKPHEAAARIAELFMSPNWRGHYAELGKENLARWNALAQQDRRDSISFLSDLCRDLAQGKRPGDTRPDATGAS